jgi:hypothetical protein
MLLPTLAAQRRRVEGGAPGFDRPKMSFRTFLRNAPGAMPHRLSSRWAFLCVSRRVTGVCPRLA